MGHLMLKTETDGKVLFKVCGKMVGITLNELNDLYKARTLKS